MILKNLLASELQTVTEIVPVPNLGKDAEIIVRKMTISDTILYNRMISDNAVDGMINSELHITAKLIATMVDEDGNHIAEPTDIKALAAKLDRDTVQALLEAYNALNESVDMSDEDFAEKKSKS